MSKGEINLTTLSFGDQLQIKSSDFQPLDIEGIHIDDHLNDLKKLNPKDENDKEEIEAIQNLIDSEIIDLNNSFIVKSYKLIIRSVLEIEDVKSKVKAQSHRITHEEFVNCKIQKQNSSYFGFFCPIYLMNLEYEDEVTVHYYGKTNSASPRFYNHKKLNQFIANDQLEQHNKKLLLTQVFVTFCYQNKTYEDIPLEWINFEVDKNDKQRKKLLLQLKKLKGDKRISYIKEIDKIIFFIENFLIYYGSGGNDSIQMLRSLYQIYTPNINIYFENGEEFVANSSPKSHDDATMPNIHYIGEINDYEEDKNSNILSLTNINEEFTCHDCITERHDYEFWRVKSDFSKNEEQDFWWDIDVHNID